MWIVQQNDDGSAKLLASGGNSENAEVVVEFDRTDAGGVIDAALGRGATDTDRTYLRLRRSDGVSVYVYVDTNTTLLCSTSAP